LVKIDYENLPAELSSKLVSAEKSAIVWIETRTEKELGLFRNLVKIPMILLTKLFVKK
jgi:hypothetical protein